MNWKKGGGDATDATASFPRFLPTYSAMSPSRGHWWCLWYGWPSGPKEDIFHDKGRHFHRFSPTLLSPPFISNMVFVRFKLGSVLKDAACNCLTAFQYMFWQSHISYSWKKGLGEASSILRRFPEKGRNLPPSAGRNVVPKRPVVGLTSHFLRNKGKLNQATTIHHQPKSLKVELGNRKNTTHQPNSWKVNLFFPKWKGSSFQCPNIFQPYHFVRSCFLEVTSIQACWSGGIFWCWIMMVKSYLCLTII